MQSKQRRTDLELRAVGSIQTTRRDAEEKLSPEDEKRIAEIKKHYGWDIVRADALGPSRPPRNERIRAHIFGKVEKD